MSKSNTDMVIVLTFSLPRYMVSVDVCQSAKSHNADITNSSSVGHHSVLSGGQRE